MNETMRHTDRPELLVDESQERPHARGGNIGSVAQLMLRQSLSSFVARGSQLQLILMAAEAASDGQGLPEAGADALELLDQLGSDMLLYAVRVRTVARKLRAGKVGG